MGHAGKNGRKGYFKMKLKTQEKAFDGSKDLWKFKDGLRKVT